MRILGIDWGERRVGMAVSDPMGMIATPLRVAEVRNDAEAVTAARDALAETEAELIVVGLPLNMDGTSGPKVQQVMAFCRKLESAVDVPVATSDERLSSRLVERAMLEGDLSRKKRKSVRDMLAAQVILQGYLDTQSSTMDMP